MENVLPLDISPLIGCFGLSRSLCKSLLTSFSNEAVDATHLCEFHQVEGVIADYGLTLGGLMAFMETFFGKMGIKK
jgi:hypothetical protein